MEHNQSIINDLKNGMVLAGVESRTLTDSPTITFFELASVMPSFFMAWADRAAMAMCGQRVFDCGYVVDADSPGLVSSIDFREFNLAHASAAKTYLRAPVYNPDADGHGFKLALIKSGMEMATQLVGKKEATLRGLIDDAAPHGTPISLPARHEVNLLIFADWMMKNQVAIEKSLNFKPANNSKSIEGAW